MSLVKIIYDFCTYIALVWGWKPARSGILQLQLVFLGCAGGLASAIGRLSMLHPAPLDFVGVLASAIGRVSIRHVALLGFVGGPVSGIGRGSTLQLA